MVQAFFNVIISTIVPLLGQFAPKSISFLTDNGIQIPHLGETISKFSYGVPMALLNTCATFSSIVAIRFINIPLYLALRRLQLLSTLILNILVNKDLPNGKTMLRVGLMLLGAIMACYTHFYSAWMGIVLVLLCNTLMSLYFVLAKKFHTAGNIAPFEVNFYFAWVALPLMSAHLMYTGEYSDLYKLLALKEKTGAFLLFLSGPMGISLTVSSLLVVKLLSPIALNVASDAKNAFAIVASFIIFQDFSGSWLELAGLFINCVGGSLQIIEELFAKKKVVENKTETPGNTEKKTN